MPPKSKSLPLASDPALPPEVKGTFSFVSLGCPKNTVDSERMLGKLAQDGYALQAGADGADVVVVNTCGFIEPARQESLAVIREMLALKEQGRVGAVVVAGCLAERNREQLLDEVPGVDQIVGVFGRESIARAMDAASRKSSRLESLDLFPPAPVRALEDTARLRITPRHFAYLKISEGCDRLCTYCIIPKMRGKHATKPIEEVVREARELAADGVRELVIVGQDTTYYGMDLYGQPRLADLLRELSKVDGIEWIRLLYAYPEHFTDDLFEALGHTPKVIPYLDMPLQHINSRMLKRMQRRVNREKTIELVEKLRERIPNLVLRTTFITGFPGETDAEFSELRAFVADARFERMGVFTYSPEPGTPAMKLEGHLPDDVKEARREELMAVQQDIAFEFGDSLIGYELDCLIDEPIEEGLWAGRIYADAPEIDGTVYVQSDEPLTVGSLIPVEIAARQEYDLVGTPS